MPRNITVHFSDGTAHQYNNAPDVLTPDDIEKRTKKDYPNKKIVRIDGGKKSAEPTASKPQDAPKNQSQFSIKGLRFGMSVEEVYSITNPQETKHEYDRTSGSIKSFSTPRKSSDTLSDIYALEGFSIGGETGWTPTFKNKELMSIGKTIPPESAPNWLNLLSTHYGKPSHIDTPIVSNRMGHKDQNITAIWINKDAVIYLTKYAGRFTEGVVSIAWKKYNDNLDLERKKSQEKAKKDF